MLARVEGPEADPWIEEQIDAAVAPYVTLLPPEEIAWMRDRLFEALTTERRGRELVRRARPRKVVRSGTVRTDDARAEAPSRKRRGGAG